jgi:hypothetical protein
MKYILAVILVFALAFTASAATLSAAVAEPDNSYFWVSNCKGAGDGPTQVSMRFIVTNNWNVPMTVRYDYFDYGTDSWVEGDSQICTIAANMPANDCRLTAPLKLGGRGNGTMTEAVYIRLKGMDPDNNVDTITKDFSFKFEHYTADSEINVLNKISALQTLISKLGSAGSCGPTAAELATANSAITSAEVALKACDLKAAYNGPANELKALEKYSDESLAACTAAAPATPAQPTAQPEPTAVPTPAGPTPAAAPSSPAAQAAQPAQQGNGLCAIGFALPLLGLFALWRKAV